MKAFPRFLVLFLLIATVARAQTATQLINSDGKIVGAISDINGSVITTIRSNDIQGKPYLRDEWNKGAVYFSKGKKYDSMWLQFDLLNNKLYFKRDGIIQQFIEQPEAFWFYPVADSSQQLIFFRSGYPDQGAQNKSTYYEVLADGNKMQLLRYRSVKISENYVYNAPHKKHTGQMMNCCYSSPPPVS